MKKLPSFSKILLWLIPVLILFCFFLWSSQAKKPSLKIKDQVFLLEVAETPRERSQGLSGRKSLLENQGMLFVFEKPSLHPFWMKEMNFSLDIIFIENDEIVEIITNLPPPQPGQRPRVVYPQKPASLVLEINGGLAQKLNLQPGDSVHLSL